MPRIGLEDVRGLPDPLLQWNYDLFVTNMPVGDTRQLAIQTLTAQIPGNSVELAEVMLHGVRVGYSSRPMFTNNITTNHIETRALAVRDTIRAWIEFQKNARTNTGSYKVDYEGVGDLVLYDDTGGIVRTIRMYGFYPISLVESDVDGSSSSPVQFSVNWQLDYHVDL